MPPKRASKSRKDDDDADVETIIERSHNQPSVEADLSNVMQEVGALDSVSSEEIIFIKTSIIIPKIMLICLNQGQKRQVVKRRQAEKSQVEAFAHAQEELAALNAEHSAQL